LVNTAALLIDEPPRGRPEQVAKLDPEKDKKEHHPTKNTRHKTTILQVSKTFGSLLSPRQHTQNYVPAGFFAMRVLRVR